MLALATLATIGVACTDDFNDINTNKNGITYGDGGLFKDASNYLPSQMQWLYPCNGGPSAAGWVFQVQQNFNSDIYSGYWMQASTSGFTHGANIETNYVLVQGWDDFLFQGWANSMTSYKKIKDSESKYPTNINKNLLGMANVTKIILASRAADAIGTLPYTSFGSDNLTYDSMQKIYNTFFSELDTALAKLDPTVDPSVIGSKDLFYGGDAKKWIKLANSIRLQLAMRIVKADPATAKLQAEKAMQGDLILDNSDNAAYNAPLEGAITTVSRTWGAGNTAPGADLYSFLVGYNDPRLGVVLSKVDTTGYALKNPNANKPCRIPQGGYSTMRLGSFGVTGDNFDPKNFSWPGKGVPASGTTCSSAPQSSSFFNSAETYFLLAEASLRGWNLGKYASTAQTLYENGVKASMSQWGEGIGSYLTTTAQPANYVDPTLPVRDIAAVSTCSPKWSDATTNEGHLEQIITQKWIALWPINSPVSWAEYRRTGYPRLFPPYQVAASGVKGTLTWGGITVNGAKKIMLPVNEYQNNAANVRNAVNNFLGGKDEINTPVWWDVNAPNF